MRLGQKLLKMLLSLKPQHLENENAVQPIKKREAYISGPVQAV
jgi:hypothetical protein